MDGTVVGTAEYISPEQVTGQDTDHRSDQYAARLHLGTRC